MKPCCSEVLTCEKQKCGHTHGDLASPGLTSRTIHDRFLCSTSLDLGLSVAGTSKHAGPACRSHLVNLYMAILQSVTNEKVQMAKISKFRAKLKKSHRLDFDYILHMYW